MKNNKLTVCILTAGKGSRVGKISEYLNKSLLPINKKAAISWIIEKFPKDTEFIIATGFLSHQVEEFFQIYYKNLDVKFVKVDNYDKPGSGPGHSLLCCKDFLQKPFYFVACDTLWEDELDKKFTENWFAVSNVPLNETSSYCNLKIENGKIVDIKDKENVSDYSYKAFVGLCHIKDYNIFWESLLNNDTIKGEKQISNGIRGLLSKKKVFAYEIIWNDIGDTDKYANMVKKYENFDFSKSNECIYLSNEKVIKFFSDTNIVKKRIERTKINKNVFPEILYSTKHFYSYRFQEGNTLYQQNSEVIFKNLLTWLSNNLWKKVNIKHDLFYKSCLNFYKVKTFERLKNFIKNITTRNHK